MAEHPDYQAEFVNARVEDVIVNLQKNQFDLVLGLSVFHHLCNQYGWQNVNKLLATLADKVPFGIFELALKTEQLTWAKALPENYRDLLSGFAFTKLIAYNGTHLSTVKRPLTFASKYFFYDINVGFLKINFSRQNSHDFAPKEVRRKYFICGNGNVFVKQVIRVSENDIKEAQREIEFLQKFGGKDGFPIFYSASTAAYESDVEFVIVREKLDGVLLSDKIKSGEDFDSWVIIEQVLSQLVLLEAQGYYHNDVRVWNVLCADSGKAYLIGYGSISRESRDVAMPYDLRMSFFRFMNEVFEKSFALHRPTKFLTALKKYIPIERYKKILEINPSEKFFAQLYDVLFNLEVESERIEEYTLAELELLALEELVDTLIKP